MPEIAIVVQEDEHLRIEAKLRPGIAQISPYVPGLTDDQLRAKFGLSSVVKLNANENALGPSPVALAALAKEVVEVHHYPDGNSDLLRQAVAGHHDVPVDHVLAGNGSDNVIKLIAETFLNPGDNIVVPRPTFSEYALSALMMGAHVKEVDLNPDFSYNVEALVSAVDADTKLLFICSPNNPTSTVMTQSEFDWVLQAVPTDVVVVVDLAYNDYSLRSDRVQLTPQLFDSPRVITLHTFSKLYGLAGLRVGYGLAHPEIWSYVNRIREPFNVNRLAQRAATAALTDETHRLASQDLAATGKAQYAQFAAAHGLFMPAGEGNFTLLRVGDGKAVTEALMSKGVMVRHGFPGVLDCIRITYGIAAENEQCLQALDEVLAVLQR